jgi:regulatory protein
MKATPTRRIEDIVPDTRREGSVRLVASGRTLLSVPLEAVVAERIEPGSTLVPEQLDRLERAADAAAAYRTAVRLLARRQYARRDLGRRLGLKGHSRESVQAALDRAEAAGYLDDERFATDFVQSRTAQGRGPVRLRRELLMMGVARSTVDQALGGEVNGPEAQRRRVEQLIAKRLPQLQARQIPNPGRRLAAFLARRGFGGGEVARLVRSAVRASIHAAEKPAPPD